MHRMNETNARSRQRAHSVKSADSARPTVAAGAKRALKERRRGKYGPAIAHLRRADPVLARLIDAYPDFNPRAWLAELPPMDAFGAIIFQVAGQQLSVKATRSILGRIQMLFGG
jgi:3-methyladenine DNA glycosylase/8-oxoguanine DNA glycosylase